MKKIKRLLVIILCLTMLISTIPISVFATSTENEFSYTESSDNTIIITGYNGSEKNIVIPSTINGRQVKKIGDWAFNEKRNFESIFIPQGVTEIGSRAFQYATGMKTIYIPLSCTSMGFCAFNYCWGLTDVYYEGTESQFNAIGKSYAGLGGFDELFAATKHYNYSYNSDVAKIEDGFNFYMDCPSNYLTKGSVSDLHIGYYSNGTLDSSVDKYIYTNSNSDIISLTDIGWSNEYGQKLKITAKEEGISTITVTNPVTSESSSLEIYVTGSDSGWNFYNIPKMVKEAGKVTNFYNFSGMVIDDFSYEEHKSSSGTVDYYKVKMNVYNSNNLYGAVTSYTSDGKVYGYYVIDKKSDYDKSFVSSCKSLYYETGDLFYLISNKYYYSGKSVSKKTEVKEIDVPVGGYLSISNNIKESEVASVANFCGLVMDMATLIGDFADMEDDGEWFDEVKNQTIKEILDKIIEEKLLDAFEKASAKTIKNFDISQDNIKDFLNAVGEKMFKEFGENLTEEIEQKFYKVSGLASVGESVLKKVIPTGWLIKLLYSFNEGCDFALCLNQYLKSGNRPVGIQIYAPTDSSKYQTNGIKVDTSEDVSNTVVHAYTVSDTTKAGINNRTFKNDATYYGERFKTYNITLYKNGIETQPSSTVTVRIPIPSNFNKLNRSGLKVYRNNEDGTLKDMNAHIEGEYIVFETDHFSYYSVVDENEPIISDELKFTGASLTLHNSLEINYKAPATLIDNGYVNLYVKYELDGSERVIDNYNITDSKIVFNYSDIIPDQMGDTISTTLYAERDGVIYQGETKEYSVAQYCYNLLGKYSGDENAKLRTLLVDLLNYGSASQIYTGHNTENLANAKLTEEQKGFATVAEPTLTTVKNTAYKTIENPAVTWKGAGLNLQKSVTMRFKIAADSIDGLSVKVESESNGKWIIPAKSFVKTDGGYYIYFNGLNAGQMSEPVYLTVYNGDTAVSDTICYSVESYAYTKKGSTDVVLNDLLIAMMKYGNAAYAYTH